MAGFGAEIVSLEEFGELRAGLGRVVATSGGFDPIHPGHVSCIVDSKRYADVLVVIVNGDRFLEVKKGKAFQDVRTRCLIVSGLRGVDFVIPFDAPTGDQSVNAALEVIRPDVFTKGGDRVDVSTIPEWAVCQRLGARVVTGVGMPKEWSSSDLLRSWTED